ncbi:unnamed protein product [Sphagnum balticum]
MYMSQGYHFICHRLISFVLLPTALGFRTAILRHRAADFKLQVRRDGYVAVAEILKLSMKTMAGKPLNSHTEDDVRQVSKVFLKQRHLANQGHTINVIPSIFCNQFFFSSHVTSMAILPI